MTKIGLVSMGFVLVVGLTTGGAQAQVLYTLVSPNPEWMGSFGNSVSGAGDVNNDTYDDVIVGADWEDGEAYNAGRAYIFSGSEGGLLHTLVSPNPEWMGHFGNSVSGAGDVNNDTYDDVIVGAYDEDGGADDAGRAYIFSGNGGGLLYTLVSPNPEENGNFGISVSGAGDVNNDTYHDVIVGAYQEDGGANEAGCAYIFSGNGGGLLYTLVSPNPEGGGFFGRSVSGAGDVNNDTYDDVIVGTLYEDGGAGAAGSTYIFSGNGGGLLYALVSPNPEVSGRFGYSVSGAGDVNNDMYDDVIVGAYQEDGGDYDAGRAYVFSGNGGGLLYTLVSPRPEGAGRFGRSVSGAGDVNNDTYDDVIVGADQEDVGAYNAGRAYIFSGNGGGLLHSLVSPNPGMNDIFGCSVSGAGDVNNDTYADVIVGACVEDIEFANDGCAYVFDGVQVPVELALFEAEAVVGQGVLLKWVTESEEENFGFLIYRSTETKDSRERITDELIPGAGTTAIPQSYSYLDRVVEPGPYLYWLEQVDLGGATTVYGPASAVVAPAVIRLQGPYPNPTSGEMRMSVWVPDGEPREVELSLYDLAGKHVGTALRETEHRGGSLEVSWAPDEELCSGVYWWHLTAGDLEARRPMIIVR
jgi:hypothetical protein